MIIKCTWACNYCRNNNGLSFVGTQVCVNELCQRIRLIWTNHRVEVEVVEWIANRGTLGPPTSD